MENLIRAGTPPDAVWEGVGEARNLAGRPRHRGVLRCHRRCRLLPAGCARRARRRPRRARASPRRAGSGVAKAAGVSVIHRQEARSNNKNLINEPPDHAIGRSRRGFSTKIHALTGILLPADTAALAGPGRRQPVPGTDARSTPYPRHRSAAGRQGVLAPEHPKAPAGTQNRAHTSPNGVTRSDAAWPRGRMRGRPPAVDKDRYRKRNTVEHGFGRLKRWRGIATRYDKYAATHLDGVLLEAFVIHHHVRKSQTRSRRRNFTLRGSRAVT